MYKDTVTVFNCKKGALGDTWFPTVLKNVNLNIDKGAIAEKYGPGSEDVCVLNVKYQERNGSILIGESVWLPPKEWQALENHAGFITFNAETDFFWAGAWSGEITQEDFYGWMLGTHDFVFAITGVGYFSVLPHFEVTGK